MCRQQPLCDSCMALSRTSLATFAFGLRKSAGGVVNKDAGRLLDIGAYNCRPLKGGCPSVKNKDWPDSIEEKLADPP